MKITAVETYVAGNPWKNWTFAVLRTDEGLHGVGEGTVNLFAKTVEAGIRELSQLVVGADPFRVEALVQRLWEHPYTHGGQIHGCAVAAIEAACWDLKGKALGVPVYDLMGGKVRETIRAYANGWYQGERTPESFAKRAKEVVARGYTALKFDPFGKARRTMSPRDEALSVDIVAAVREAVGPRVDLMVEGHCRFSVPQALQVARKIAPYDPMWFEEPVPFKNTDAIKRVAEASPVNIATGESFSSLHDFAELMQDAKVHILQPENMNLGGLWTCRQVCALAEAHHAVVAPHNAQGPVSTAMCVQLAGCVPNYLIQEFFDEFNVGWAKDLVKYHVRFENGELTIPDVPGLGVELNLEALKELPPYDPGNYLPLFEDGWERREGKGGRKS